MKYIDSEKLIAEINNRLMSVNLEKLGNFGLHRVWAYNDVKDLITSLQQEQPEVDLEKEILDWIGDEGSCKNGKWTWYECNEMLRYFYELGLKARKEE